MSRFLIVKRMEGMVDQIKIMESKMFHYVCTCMCLHASLTFVYTLLLVWHWMYCNGSTHPVCSKHLLLCIGAINRHGPIFAVYIYILLTNDMCWLYKIDIDRYMGSLILRRGLQFSGDLGTGDPQIS